MRLSLLHRIWILILATLPVAWGNCPGWFDGGGACGDTAEAASTEDAHGRPACPCCAKRSEEDRPLRGCDDCPIVAVRRTASPASLPVVLPPPALIGPWIAPRIALPSLGAGVVASIDDSPPPGRPPDLVGIVVLLV